MKEPTRAPFFACLYPGLCDIARANGYALSIHGTVTADLDLVAIPWTDAAITAEALMHKLKDHIGALDYRGLLVRDCGSWAAEKQIDQMVQGENERQGDARGPFGCALKPHGRKAWNLYMDAGAKVDLSVMPTAPEGMKRPRVVCLCGSTRFMDAFQRANLKETVAGRIVLSIGCNTKSDSDLIALGELTEEAKAALDELHKRKIDLADEVLVLDVGGYIGESTRSEIAYAEQHGKSVRYLSVEGF